MTLETATLDDMSRHWDDAKMKEKTSE
jgi:hypothetical protein